MLHANAYGSSWRLPRFRSMSHGPASPQHARSRRRGRPGRVVALVVMAGVAFAGSSVGALGLRLELNLDTVHLQDLVGPAPVSSSWNGADGPAQPGDPGAGRAMNLLVLGSDQRDGQNAVIGGAEDTMGSDTTIVVHLAADRSRVELVSIPRDSLVDIPSCLASNGATTQPHPHDQINHAFDYGWQAGGDMASAAACTVRTVQSTTGLTIDHVIVVDFVGFQAMVGAIGGVDLCIPRQLDDPRYTGLHLLPGDQHLDGVQALQLARARHGNIGNGGDLARIGNQQRLVAAIAGKVLSADVLANPAKLTAFLQAATSSLTVDDRLDLAGMVGLAYSLRSIEASDITLTTLPTQEAPENGNRLVWAPAAADVWANLAADLPITQADGSLSGAPGARPPSAGDPSSSTSTAAAAASSPAASPEPTRTRETGVEPFTPADVTAVCG